MTRRREKCRETERGMGVSRIRSRSVIWEERLLRRPMLCA